MLYTLAVSVLVVLASGRDTVEPHCPNLGDFPDLTSKDPRSYVSCTENKFGVFSARIRYCADGEVFDLLTRKCISQLQIDSLLSENVSSDDQVTVPTATFVCEEKGSFPDPMNKTLFYYCVPDGNDWILVHMSCNPGFEFSPEVSQCVLETTTTASTGGTSTVPTITPEQTTTTDEPTTDEPTTTEESTTAKPVTTEEPNTSESGGTVEPTTSEPEPSSSNPETTEGEETSEPTTAEVPTSAHTTSEPPTSEPSNGSTTTEPPTTEEPTSVETGTTEAGTGGSSTTEEQLPSELTTEEFSTTTEESEGTTAKPFICPGLGPFPNPASKNSFYYCILNDDGFIPILIGCGQGSEYIPEIQTCGIPGNPEPTTEYPETEGSTPEPEPFVCTAEGLFPDPLDPRKFYYCYKDSDGGYIPIQMVCGAGTQFIPEINGCGIPGEIEPTEGTTVEPGFVCTEAGLFPNPDDKNSFYLCIPDGNDGYIQIQMGCGTGMEFDPESSTCENIGSEGTTAASSEGTTIEPGFICTEAGLFPNPDDKNSFYLCIPDGNDGYIQIQMGCGTGMEFDPESSTCENIGSEGTTAASSEGTTIEPGFICTEAGLFPNPDDKNSFYLCIPDGNDGYIQIQMGCGTGMEFDPESSTCENIGSEGTTAASSEGTTIEPGFICTEAGLFPNPDDRNSFYLCIPDGNDGYIQIQMGCGTGMEFDPESSTCENIGSEATTTDEPTGTTPVPFLCPSAGVFADPFDKTKFYQCIENENGDGYHAIQHQCSLGQFFDPEKGYCSLPAPETEPTTQSTSPQTTTTDEPTGTTPEPFLCPSAGVFADPFDNTKFYQCIENENGDGYHAIQHQCSLGQIFDPEKGYCSLPAPETEPTTQSTTSQTTTTETTTDTSTSESPTTESTTPEPTTTESSTPEPTTTESSTPEPTTTESSTPEPTTTESSTPEPTTTESSTPESTTTESSTPEPTTPAPFVCTGPGLFPDPTNKRNFYLCIQYGTTYIPILLECPSQLVYDPATFSCIYPNEPPPTTPSPFQCPSAGIFTDPNSCQSFYKCFLDFNGGFIPIKMACPQGTNFYENMQICVSNMIAPCPSQPQPQTTSVPASGKKFKCVTVGTFPDPCNSRKYFECQYDNKGKLKQEKRKCNSASHYSSAQERCVYNWQYVA